MAKNANCDFCHRNHKEVGQLVESPALPKEQNQRKAGTTVFICSECLEMGLEVVKPVNNELNNIKFNLKSIPSPKEIVSHLDQWIIGQTKAKKVLSVAVTSHYKRLQDEMNRINKRNFDDPLADTVIEKSNILLVGPTGSGKTLLCKTLAKFLQVPFAIGDATTVTEAGYVGEDVENLVLKLLRNADFEIDLCQTGIIYVDEIDKIAKRTGNVSLTRDVSGEGVQQSLLKIIEGTTCNVPPTGGRKHPEAQYIPIDTTNILFICGGTFVGIEDIIKRRMNKKSIGFGQSYEEENKDKILENVLEEDFIEFGMIPEFIGRLPVQMPLSSLDEDTLVNILTEPKDSLVKQYKKLCRFDGVGIDFTDKAIREIAKIAIKKGTGARALRAVVESFMGDIMFHLPEYNGKNLVIDEKVVLKEKFPFNIKEAA